jgi:hypothetical protein
LPFSILFEIARNVPNEVAADAGHLSPSRIFIGEVKAATGGAGVPAISDAEKIERHGEKPMLRPTLGPAANDNLFRVVGSYNRFGAIPLDYGVAKIKRGLGDPRKPSTPEHNRYRVVLSPLAEGIAGD